MLNPQTALQAAVRTPAPAARAAHGPALVVGAGGKLGTAVLQALLAGGGMPSVGALVQRRLQHAVRGFHAVDEDDAALARFGAHTAVVVLEATTSRLKLEAPFVQPAPAQLLALAQRLRAAGVRAVLVLTPHRAGLLPRALQVGLANLDESAVAALGFEQLVFMRVAQEGPALQALLSAPQRLALWMLSQLHWMVPQQEQAVRLETVARVAAAWATLWPCAAPGTRVLPPEVLWQAAQVRDASAVVATWLGASRQAPVS
jgi:hypothetical protein